MDRDNFYILLELSIDPPEEDPAKIEEALKKKQTEWSRLRNHPTKGIQAKKYISLLPEIRKVMADDALRRSEAADAAKRVVKREEERLSELDRHLDIRMSKGFITESEIFKLAELHSLPEAKVRQRIKAREEGKLAEIDKHLTFRMSKGYITEEEIARLSKLHGMNEEEIRKRVKGPIKKESETGAEPGKDLEKAIEKVIKDNLAIVGNSSLYEFLGIAPGAALEDLQRRAKEREAEILRIRIKDAGVTAGGVLAGQCMAVFQSEETRRAYDRSLGRAHLNTLNADIDVAGMDGKIRAEYLDVLIQSAMGLGMDREEAGAYIREYCRKKKWIVEKTPEKRHFPIPLPALVVGLVVLLVAAGITIWLISGSRLKEKEYGSLMAKVEKTGDLEAKTTLLKDYIAGNPRNQYTQEAEKKLKEVRKALEEGAFQEAVNRAKGFMDRQDYEQAMAVFDEYLAQHLDSPHGPDIERRIFELTDMIDERNYAEVKEAYLLNPFQKIAKYRDYLKKNPKGKHRDEVRKLIADMKEEYYIYTNKQLDLCNRNENWEECIELCNSFIESYENDKRSIEFTVMIDAFQNNIRNDKILANLMARAEKDGLDYEGKTKVYAEYLEAYPSSSLRDRIERELARLKAQWEQVGIKEAENKLRSLLAASGGRYVEKAPGTVTDTRTGLMWCLRDSHMQLGHCLTYSAAVEYVRGLRTGDFRDWRLPSAAELAGIYKSGPFFPSLVERWYWSADNHKRYAEGWGVMVDVVSSKQEKSWEKLKRDSAECATVRAVR